MIVIDASAVVEFILKTPRGPVVAEWVLESGEVVIAPHLVDLEVVQVLRRYVQSGQLTDELALRGLQNLLDLPLVRHSHHVILPRIWALRQNLTAYDGAYVALAQATSATLITCDSKLAHAPGLDIAVELIA